MGLLEQQALGVLFEETDVVFEYAGAVGLGAPCYGVADYRVEGVAGVEGFLNEVPVDERSERAVQVGSHSRELAERIDVDVVAFDVGEYGE